MQAARLAACMHCPSFEVRHSSPSTPLPSYGRREYALASLRSTEALQPPRSVSRSVRGRARGLLQRVVGQSPNCHHTAPDCSPEARLRLPALFLLTTEVQANDYARSGGNIVTSGAIPVAPADTIRG